MSEPTYRNDVAAYIALEGALHGLECAALTAPDLENQLQPMIEWTKRAIELVYERIPQAEPAEATTE